MTDKRIGRVYKSVINKITKKIKTQHNCMKRATNNPDYVYMLGNKCIKPDVKSTKQTKYRKSTLKHMKKRRNKKTKRVKYNQKGGGLFGNLVNGTNVLTSGIREVSPPPSVLPWEGNFSRNYFKI